MKNIKIFEDFVEDLSLPAEQQQAITDWVNSHENEYDFSDDAGFDQEEDKMIDDCMSQLGIDKKYREDVKSFVQGLDDLSDDMQTIPGVVMDPVARLNYNQIDNVQRFNY
jgi:hypothetical protein